MFQVASACYSTALQAAQVSASSQLGSIVTHGGFAYVVDLSDASANSLTYRLQPLQGGTPIQSTVSYTPQPCGLLQAEDAISIGWMIAAAWIAIYALLFLAKAFRVDPSETYGNS